MKYQPRRSRKREKSMNSEFWATFLEHLVRLHENFAPGDNVVSPSEAASLHQLAEPSTNETGLIPTDRGSNLSLLSSWGGGDTMSPLVSSSTLRDYGNSVYQQIIRPPQGGEFASGQNPGGMGASKNGDFGNMPSLSEAVTSSSTGRGDMIIVRAPSPGGPVEILDIPEAEPQADQEERTVSGYGNQGEDQLFVEKIRRRFTIYEDPGRDVPVEDIEALISLKREIIGRMSQLDPHPFWVDQQNRIIGESILTPKGAEYQLTTLLSKRDQLFSEHPTTSRFFQDMVKMRTQFLETGSF